MNTIRDLVTHGTKQQFLTAIEGQALHLHIRTAVAPHLCNESMRSHDGDTHPKWILTSRAIKLCTKR